MIRLFFYGLCLCLFAGCVKDTSQQVIIKGTLLQSSSNPVPVPGYVLTFYQAGSADQLGSGTIGASSSMADFNTDASGHFEGKFTLGNGSSTLGFNPGTNRSLIDVSGMRNTGVQVDWEDLYASSQDLGTLYLYKKVNRAIIQIYTSAGIVPTDTLYLEADTPSGYEKRYVTNLSIAGNGGFVTIDTIPNVIFTYYSVSGHYYLNDIRIGGNNLNKYYTAGSHEAGADEDEKTYNIILP